MMWVLVLPASTVALTLVVLALSMARVEREIVELRRSLRRAQAAAVATDELRRAASAVAGRAAAIEADTRRRFTRPRSRHHRGAGLRAPDDR